MSPVRAALRVPIIDRRSLHKVETHFIAPEIYRRDDVSHRQAELARMVSHEIAPRLLRLHTEAALDVPPVTALIEALSPSSADISGLADIVLGPDLEAAAAYIVVLRDRGLSMDALFVELLEPTARHLGELWNRDACDFIDVTLGVGRLQKLLAIFNETHDIPALETRRRVLMAMAPGDQHSFGVMMVDQFLSAAGWQVHTEVSANADEIVDLAQSGWFAVIGLTAGSDRQLATLGSLIARLREQSRNDAVAIMVGGPMFTANPALASEVGADATACNAPAAVLVAQKLFDTSMVRNLPLN
jgi:methanogenic corrinoid protein MtbC1